MVRHSKKEMEAGGRLDLPRHKRCSKRRQKNEERARISTTIVSQLSERRSPSLPDRDRVACLPKQGIVRARGKMDPAAGAGHKVPRTQTSGAGHHTTIVSGRDAPNEVGRGTAD